MSYTKVSQQPVIAPVPKSLHREIEPLVAGADDINPSFAERMRRYERPESLELNCSPLSLPTVAAPCCVASGYQPVVPQPNRCGDHISRVRTSATEMHNAVGEKLSDFLESLLNLDDRQEREEALFIKDALRIPWLRILAKLASREIQLCCIPVSLLAGKWLQQELRKIKDSTVDLATGPWGCCMSDRSTQVTGEVRAQRVVSAVIRAETTMHAWESTLRKKPPKHQKQHDHSVFRQLAQGFEPPGPTQEDVDATQSNHPVAGASRKVGVTATRNCLHNAGFRMFDMSISGAMRDHKATGRREVHDIKDLQHAHVDGKFEQDMVYTFVDQDYYIDSFAPYAGSNMVVITAEYNKLAGEGTDSNWYYTEHDGEVVVVERVAGSNGATYSTQRPWNYTANDFIYIEHLGKTTFTTYNVIIKFQPGTHRKWVWLSRVSTTRLSKSVCDMMRTVAQESGLGGMPLRKANNVVVVQGDSKLKQDKFLLGMFGDPKSPTFSIKYACDEGPNTSQELSENQFRVFNLMGKNQPKGYGVSEVKRTMQMHMVWRPGGLEPLIVAFFKIPVEYRPRPNIMYTRQDGSLAGEVDEGAPALEGAPNAFGGGPGVADTKSDAAHDAYKAKRLEEYSNKIDPPKELKEVVAKLHTHFVEQVSRETGITLASVPLCGAEVIYERRTQALQAARLKRHSELVARPPVGKTNLKNEVGPKASVAPRGITQYNEEMAIQTGRVGLLIKEVLKHCSFYMPGNSPNDIALAIRHLTQIAMESHVPDGERQVSGVHDTDYTKMDETISKYIYEEVFVKFVLAFVHPNDCEEVKKVLADNVDITTMLNGKPINTGFKNNSGSGVTTELNTIVAAFVEYVSTCLAITKHVYRVKHTKEVDFSVVRKNTIRNALVHYRDSNDLSHIFWGGFMFRGVEVDIYSIPYAVIGPKFGDDGVGAHLPHITDADWQSAAMWFTVAIGMKLKVSFSRPEDGTFFLGRFYPRPLQSLASYADVAKACRKISIARNSDIEKYKLKLHGYWTTDSKTPGIREYLIAVARVYGVELRCYEGIVELDGMGRPVLSDEMAHLLANDKDMFYRVANGPYDVTDEDVPMMSEAIAPQLNFESSAEFEMWIDALQDCATWEELDAFQIPGADFDPDAEPEGTVRMSGPAANLLQANSPQPSATADCSFEDVVLAAELAVEQYLAEVEDSNPSECAEAA